MLMVDTGVQLQLSLFIAWNGMASAVCFPESVVPRSGYSTTVETAAPELGTAGLGLLVPAQ